MKRIFVTTIAGCASRFNQNTAKAIYYEGKPRNTLLYAQCAKARECEHIVIVAGYKYEQVLEYTERFLLPVFPNISIVFNPRYASFGSCYSLLLGLEKCEQCEPSEIVFAEGDLYFDAASFYAVLHAPSDVLTVTSHAIDSRKSVIFYENEIHLVKYLYNTAHGTLYIPEPFYSVYNSAQIWKFRNTERLFSAMKNLAPQQVEASNLEIINSYFFGMPKERLSLIPVKDWVNCNTITDYQSVIYKLEGENNETN